MLGSAAVTRKGSKAMTVTARDKAEELLQTLQRRARELLEAEDRLLKLVRNLIDDHGLSPNEVRKRLEDLLGRIKAHKLWERLRGSDAVIALSDYRDGFERYAEESISRLLGSLPVATKDELKSLKDQLTALERRLSNLTGRLDNPRTASPSDATTASRAERHRGHKRRGPRPTPTK
jgi:polyhydroxyalkanoate synthesis regulator phasin